MNGGQTRIPITKEEKIFDRYARLMMKRWDYMKFSRKFPTLLDTIRTSMKRYAEIEVARYKVELKDSKDSPRAIISEIAKKHHDPMWDKVFIPTIEKPQRHEWVKDIKDTSDTDATKGKRFARTPKVCKTPYCQRTLNYVYYTALYGSPRTQDCAIEYIVTHQDVISSRKIKRVPYFTFKPHRNIRRHRCTK